MISFEDRSLFRVSGGAVLIAFFLMCLSVENGFAQANLIGQWTTLPYSMPINPVHAALLNTGKVLILSGSGGNSTSTNYQVAVWNPSTGQIDTQTVSWDVFCNGATILPDGRVFVDGGTIRYTPSFLGASNVGVFDPLTETFSNLPSMAKGRWYPTVITLADESVMAFSGFNETGSTSTFVETFNPALNAWSPKYQAGWVPPLYPRLHLLPNGNVFYSGPTGQSRYYFPSAHTWSPIVTNTNFTGKRTYGSSVLLPLTPANNYKPEVFIMGGGNPATATTEWIDLSSSTPTWQWGAAMSQPRIQMNAVLLPTGKVLALGGSGKDEQASTASLNADLYDPTTNTFSSAGANRYPRLYHSVALLLPDATVWLAGSNPSSGNYDSHMEIYAPSYLFTTDNSGNVVSAVRPSIASAPTSVAYGVPFSIVSPDTANVSSVVIVKAGSVTHAFNFDQRVVGLSYTANASMGTLTVTGPPDSNVAPAGYYMLFLVNSAGVPSLAKWVQVDGPHIQPILSFALLPSSRMVVQGGTASFNLSTNIAPQELSFVDGGLPAGATVNFNSQSIPPTMAITVPASTPPGTYPLTVRASHDTFTQTATANLVVTVQGSFSLSASPITQSVARGSSATYMATIAPLSGFHWDVNLKVLGTTTHIKATLGTTVLNTSGTSVITVSVDSLALSGTHTLTIVGTSGNQTRSAKFDVVVP